MGSGIRFYSEDTSFNLKQKSKIRTWLAGIVFEEKQLACDLSYIFCSDSYLLELNKKFLGHDTYTDILTFSNPEDPSKIAGDIFISIDRVSENAVKYNQAFDRELSRVMVHGVLHLLGYKDKTLKEKALMSNKEDHHLEKVINY